MPLINHPNIGDVQKYAYLIATVTDVDSDNDTVDFSGVGRCPNWSNVPLFYHCSHEAEERGNGALEGAAGAFSVDDRVIVQCKVINAETYTPVRVIGFEDQPKACTVYAEGTYSPSGSGDTYNYKTYPSGGFGTPSTLRAGSWLSLGRDRWHWGIVFKDVQVPKNAKILTSAKLRVSLGSGAVGNTVSTVAIDLAEKAVAPTNFGEAYPGGPWSYGTGWVIPSGTGTVEKIISSSSIERVFAESGWEPGDNLHMRGFNWTNQWVNKRGILSNSAQLIFT